MSDYRTSRAHRNPDAPPLTASEERILRSTIDDTQIFDVPVRTVKKLLALIDMLRRGMPIAPSMKAIDAVAELRGIAETAAHDPAIIAAARMAFDDAIKQEPILALEKFPTELPDIPAHVRSVIEEAVWSIKRVHPDVDAWLTELQQTASSVDFVERELVATLVHAFTYAPNAETAGVPSITFEKNADSDVPGTFFMMIGAHPAPLLARDLYDTKEAVRTLRSYFGDRIFNVEQILESGATGVVTRPVSEIADLLERGALP